MLRITLPGDGRPGGSAPRADFLAGEEPLGIRVDGTALTMTMRTPGDDLELAAGFLVSEAVIRSPADIAEIKLCDGTACGHADHDGMGNIAEVTLAAGVELAPGARRNFMTTSACGDLRQGEHRRHLRTAARAAGRGHGALRAGRAGRAPGPAARRAAGVLAHRRPARRRAVHRRG